MWKKIKPVLGGVFSALSPAFIAFLLTYLGLRYEIIGYILVALISAMTVGGLLLVGIVVYLYIKE